MRSRFSRLAAGSTVSFLLAASAIVAVAPASGALPVTLAITCDVPGTSGIHTTAVVSVSAPTSVMTGRTYHAGFRTRVVGLSPTPTIIYGFSLTSNYTIFGSASPSGPIAITQPTADYPVVHSTVSFPVVHQDFTGTGVGGFVDYLLMSIDYDYAYSSGGPVNHAHCTLDGGPAKIRSTPVSALAPLFRAPALTLVHGRTGVPYQHLFHARGAPSPTYLVSAGELPKGLTLDPNGTLRGTPTEAGTFAYVVTATNSVSPDATLAVTQKILPAVA